MLPARVWLRVILGCWRRFGLLSSLLLNRRRRCLRARREDSGRTEKNCKISRNHYHPVWLIVMIGTLKNCFVAASRIASSFASVAFLAARACCSWTSNARI
jgi:hypothetical protein